MCNFYYLNTICTKTNEMILFIQTIVLKPVCPLLIYQMTDIFQFYFVRSKSRLHLHTKAFLTLYLPTAINIYSFYNPNSDRPLTFLTLTEPDKEAIYFLCDHIKSPSWNSKKYVELWAQHHEISTAHRLKYVFHKILGLSIL